MIVASLCEQTNYETKQETRIAYFQPSDHRHGSRQRQEPIEGHPVLQKGPREEDKYQGRWNRPRLAYKEELGKVLHQPGLARSAQT